MNRVGVRGEVIDLPVLGSPDGGILRDVHRDRITRVQGDVHRSAGSGGVGPLERIAHSGVPGARDGAQQGLRGTEGSTPGRLTVGEEVRAGPHAPDLRQPAATIQDVLLGYRVERHTDRLGLEFVERNLPGVVGRAQRALGVQDQVGGSGGRSITRARRAVQRGVHHELHHLSGGARVGSIVVFRVVREAPEGFVGRGVDHGDHGPVGQTTEVHDHVRALRQAHQQRRGVGGVRARQRLGAVARQRNLLAGLDPHHLGQEALLRADLVEGHLLTTVGDQRQVQEPRVASVQQPQAVTVLGDFQFGPAHPVHHHHVEEGLGLPERQHVRERRELDQKLPGIQPFEEGATLRVEERAVIIEGAVLDRHRNLPDLAAPRATRNVQVEHVLRGGRRSREHAVEQVSRRLVVDQVVDPSPDQPEAGRTGIDVGSRHAERVVVVPERRRRLGVGVREVGVAQVAGIRARGVVEEGAGGGKPPRDVPRFRQPPGLRIAVALRTHVRTVHMGDDRDRPPIGPRKVPGAIGSADAVLAELGRIRPVNGLIDRQEVAQIPAPLVDQVVDPADVDLLVRLRLDGISGVVELRVRSGREPSRSARDAGRIGHRVCRGAVAPHRRSRQTAQARAGRAIRRRGVPVPAREDLLLELPDRDVVAVRGAVVVHHRRDHQRRHVLRYR